MATVPTKPSLPFPEPTLPERLEDSEEYRQVFAMTERLFPGTINIRRQHDPELPEEYVVFEVHPGGTFEKVTALDAEWHRELGDLAPVGFFLYHLAVWFNDDSE